MENLLLFDCDQTIWTSGNQDYISSVVSPLVSMSKNSIVRAKDGNVFTLKTDISEVFKYLQKGGNIVGIVSDNKKDMVISALKLFDIYKYVNPEAIKVKIWKGYCPKHKMIEEILARDDFKSFPHKNIYWFDDKEYSREAGLIGINFIRVNEHTDLKKIVKKLPG